MNARFDLLTQQLLNTNLADSSAEELLVLVEKYPYFSAAHLLLAKKLKNNNPVEENRHLQKALLFSHQPVAFNYSFAAEDFETFFDPGKEVIIPTKFDFTSFEDNMQPEEAEEEDAIEYEEEPEVGEDSITLVNFAGDTEDEKKLEEDSESEPPLPPVILNRQPPVEEKLQKEAEITTGDSNPAPKQEQPTKGFEKVSPLTLPSDQVLTFEPFHTVDYFASQGIKLSKEEVSTDKVGKQMKSFTQWLKTMKRLPEADQEKAMDSSQEQKVSHLAAHSVETSNVLTETMAEVWEKQGNYEKAIEVYNKLSLIYPYKNAYFAAKVEILKKAL